MSGWKNGGSKIETNWLTNSIQLLLPCVLNFSECLLVFYLRNECQDAPFSQCILKHHLQISFLHNCFCSSKDHTVRILTALHCQQFKECLSICQGALLSSHCLNYKLCFENAIILTTVFLGILQLFAFFFSPYTDLNALTISVFFLKMPLKLLHSTEKLEIFSAWSTFLKLTSNTPPCLLPYIVSR